MAELWLTADSHFGHENVIRFCNRPWVSLKDHDDGMVARWNELVKPNDVVIIVGDFAWQNHNRYIQILHGKKTLLIGSHDGMPKECLNNFTRVIGQKNQPGLLEFSVGPHRIVACHYPMVSWGASYHGSWHCHGHCHGRLPGLLDKLSMDVGVDVWDYRPVNFEVVRRLMVSKKEAWRDKCTRQNARDDEKPNQVLAQSAFNSQFLSAWKQDWDRGVYQDTDYTTRYRYCLNDTTNLKEQ